MSTTIWKSTSIVFLWLCSLSLSLTAQEAATIDVGSWKAGQVRFDAHQWTEVIVGDIPLVISVPHGGTKRPDEIADRNCPELGRIVRGIDSRTMETARAIEAAFLAKYNKRPYIIINHLARRKVDQNRDKALATCGDPLGEEAWYYFHNSIDSALAHAVQAFGSAFYIDLHGHGHDNQRLELGYSLTKASLQKAYKGDDVDALGMKSSMQNYLRKHPETTFHDILFGKNAFGTLLQDEKVAATPSKQDPHPVGDEGFWSGGYNSRRYTNSKRPYVYGFQIEAHYKGIRDTDKTRKDFAERFVKAYTKFMDKHPF